MHFDIARVKPGAQQPQAVDPLEIDNDAHDADYILITHDHYDHFSPKDIRKIAKADSILVVPEKMADKAQEVAGTSERLRP